MFPLKNLARKGLKWLNALLHLWDYTVMPDCPVLSAGSKATPRVGSHGSQISSTPPLHGGQTAPPSLYQYSFPSAIKVTPQHMAHGLSVVSAPAPVVQRPELVSAASQPHRQMIQPPPQMNDGVSGLRSTKSQRIRGATNNIRMKQLEMRESHAVVYSWYTRGKDGVVRGFLTRVTWALYTQTSIVFTNWWLGARLR